MSQGGYRQYSYDGTNTTDANAAQYAGNYDYSGYYQQDASAVGYPPMSSYPNATPSYPNATNATTSYPNATPSYQNVAPNYQNAAPSYQNAPPSYQNATPNTGGDGYAAPASNPNFDKLQEQLKMRESQLAMASNLLEQQSKLITTVAQGDGGYRSRSGDSRGYRDREDRDRGSRDRGNRDRGDRSRKRSGSDYREDYSKRRRLDDNDDRRDRRSFGDRSQPRDSAKYGRGGGGGGRGRDFQGRQGRQDRGGRGSGGRDNYSNNRRGGGRDNKRGGGQTGNRHNSQGGGESGKVQKNAKPKTVPRVDKDLSRHYCHVCEVECFNEKNYQTHMTGSRHKEKEKKLDEDPTKKVAVEEKIKKQQEERAKPLPEKIPVDHCDICDVDIHVDLENHMTFKQHRQREAQVKRGCSWCNVGGFVNFSEVLAHRLTDQHLEMRELYGGKFRSDVIPKPEIVEADDIPSYGATTPRGKDYVVPVAGFFCRLCCKFYNDEKAAKQTHSSSEEHYEQWKLHNLNALTDYHNKVAAQNALEEDAQRKVEERKRKKEEEQALAAQQAETNGEEKMDSEVEAGESAAGNGTTSGPRSLGEIPIPGLEDKVDQDLGVPAGVVVEDGDGDQWVGAADLTEHLGIVEPEEEPEQEEVPEMTHEEVPEMTQEAVPEMEQEAVPEMEQEAVPEAAEEEQDQTRTKRTRATRGRGRGRGKK